MEVVRELYQQKEELEKQKQLVLVLDQFSTYLALTLPEGSPAMENIRKQAVTQKRRREAIVSG